MTFTLIYQKNDTLYHHRAFQFRLFYAKNA